MGGGPGGTNNRILGAWPPIFPYISPGPPLHVQQLIKLLKLFQAGSNYLDNWLALSNLFGRNLNFALWGEALFQLGRALEALKGLIKPSRAL